MKALIFSMTCGEGHNMMANSLAQAFTSQGVETKIVQTFGYDQKRVEKENAMYLWACSHIPKLYDFVWNRLRNKKSNPNKLPGFVKNCLPYFTEQIAQFNPDIIMTTHLYASSVVSYMRNQNLLPKGVVTGAILQDFCLAPYWGFSIGMDYIFQPYDNTTQDLLNIGFKQSQIITMGLPIREQFYQPYNQNKVREKLNLPGNFLVLTVGGGNNLGNNFKLIKSITKKNLKDVTVVIINGKNQKNYQKIQKYIQKNKIKSIINVGYASNMHEYMQAADAVISRGGSSSLTEVISVQKPLIIREKLILNEKINKELFIENGCALGMEKLSQAAEKIDMLKSDATLYNNMLENIKKMRRTNSAQNITKFLIDKAKK